MKKFIISILCVAVFFIGLGGLMQNVGAKFKSDERALELVRQARIAIGGEEAIANVKSLSIKGKQTMTLNLKDSSTENTGDVEIALQLPNQLMKTMKFTREGGSVPDEEIIEQNATITVVKNNEGKVITSDVKGADKPLFAQAENSKGQDENIIFERAGGTTEEVKNVGNDKEFTTSDGKKVTIRKIEGNNATFTTNDGKKMIIITEDVNGSQPRQNELLRLTLALLMSAPQGVDVSYTYGGEGNVDSTVCNIINATFANETFKIFLAKSNNLPVAMNYQGMKMEKIITTKMPKDEANNMKIVVKKSGEMQPTDFQVKFSDYRNVNGVQLPYRWVTSYANEPVETLEVTNYEVNPANIAEKFNKQPQRIMVRVEKP
jgi:hypothetical protein